MRDFSLVAMINNNFALLKVKFNILLPNIFLLKIREFE